MIGIRTILSRRCCGGPVLMLALALMALGVFFILLSALGLGWVFIGIGAASFGLCLWLSQSRCPRLREWAR